MKNGMVKYKEAFSQITFDLMGDNDETSKGTKINAQDIKPKIIRKSAFSMYEDGKGDNDTFLKI
jgi:hypothetical protein